MTSGTVASYSNFRYYAEMLSAGLMDSETATALMDFRENHGGTLSGMTRYTDHLDDMPAIGYARSSLGADRIERFLLLLHGHAANYQGRGSFFSTEQQSLYLDVANPRWRANLGEIQDSFCVPSQTLVASMYGVCNSILMIEQCILYLTVLYRRGSSPSILLLETGH